jgi:hypothetical protein
MLGRKKDICEIKMLSPLYQIIKTKISVQVKGKKFVSQD